MSVIQSIRDRGAWIIFAIIALALIAFILQDGMGRRGGGFFSNTTTLGKVNGVKIDREEFDKKVTMYSQNGQDRSNIIPQLWNMEVDQILLKGECEKLGLTVTAKELGDILYGPNSPLAREQQFQDENGQFNAEAARQAITQLKKSKNNEQLQGVIDQLIKPMEQQALYTKYNALLQQSAYIPTWLIEKTKSENAAMSSISYVYVPYSTISDSTIKVTDEDITNYVKKHPKGFEKKEETRVFSYVAFDATANATDSTNALNNVTTLKNDFSAATDAKAYIGKVGSEIEYHDAYLMKSAMKMPKADSIKNLADGQTFGPYLDGSNYVIAKMIGKRNLPDSVKVRHILVKTQDRRRTVLPDSVAKKRIDSVEALARSGANFNELVKKYSDDGGSKQKGGEYDFALQGFSGISKEFAEAIFYGKTGDKVVVKVENDAYGGYHYIEVINQKNFGEAVKVAYLAKPIIASTETVNAASTAALQFAANIKNKKQFDEAAKKINKTVMQSMEVKAEDFTIQNFGQENVRSIVRWLFEKDIDDVNEPVEVGEKYIVPIVTNINKKGLENVASAKIKSENFIKNEKKAKQIIANSFKGSSLEDFAKSSNTSILRADSLSYENGNLGALGYDNKITGVAFNKNQVGKVTAPIAGNAGVIAIKVENISAKATLEDNEAVKQRILQIVRQAGSRGTTALREDASIKDYRSKFF